MGKKKPEKSYEELKAEFYQRVRDWFYNMPVPYVEVCLEVAYDIYTRFMPQKDVDLKFSDIFDALMDILKITIQSEEIKIPKIKKKTPRYVG